MKDFNTNLISSLILIYEMYQKDERIMKRAYIVENVAGIYGINENSEIIYRVLFPSTPEKIVEKIELLQSGQLIDELKDVLSALKQKEIQEIVLEDEKLARNIQEQFDIQTLTEKGNSIFKDFREQSFNIAKEEGINNFQFILQSVGLLQSQKKIKRASERRDKMVAQAIKAIDDIDQTLNLFSTRIREWYGLHFPELDKVENHETYVGLVGALGPRDRFIVSEIQRITGVPLDKAKEIEGYVKNSIGAEMDETDLESLVKFARITDDLYKVRKESEHYIENTMREVAPNVTAIVGALLGARIISIAGGLLELARLPASTVQVLGAEKALFRAIKTGSKPPKHGVLFQKPEIHNAKFWLRGKIARAVAGKLTIAARVDAYAGEFIGDELALNVQQRIEEIEKKYPFPPKKEVKIKKKKKKKKKKKSKEKRMHERKKSPEG
jgi:nucleolar protein 56